MELNRLEVRCDGIYSNRRVEYSPVGRFSDSIVNRVFDFAYDMSYGGKGKHRENRSGGQKKRSNGEIFANTFQGKLSEFAAYELLSTYFSTNEPDLSTFDLGIWDDCDFDIQGKRIAVKSTKSFGDLLLLESKDWNKDGQYIPNIHKGCENYDFFLLVRVDPSCEKLLKRERLLYSNICNRDKLANIIVSKNWSYDMPGFSYKEELILAIENEHIIFQGQMLNGKTKMDADNYYIQSGDMHNINLLIQELVGDNEYALTR